MLATPQDDRSGLGESTGTSPIPLDRELTVLGALWDQVGGAAVLCGHSSGSAIAVPAATTGLPVMGLAIWEVPTIGSADDVRMWADQFIGLLGAHDHVTALDHFTMDMPPDFKAELKASPVWPMLVENAQSLRADIEALAWFHSAPLSALLSQLTIPVLAMVGESTFEVMHQTADTITAAVPHATTRAMPGANHDWEIVPMAEALAEFVQKIEAKRLQEG